MGVLELVTEFVFEPWICRLQDLNIYFGVQIEVDIYNLWL